jgi:2-polyprenyl-3-methyl-5-hydroxy-6-metoxy-1,4-benzoquinol methylase
VVFELDESVSASRDHDRACIEVAQRFPEKWLRMYAARKLKNDPVFTAAFELFRDRTGPILDIGCGVGLLGMYLRERGIEQAVIGIDCDRRKIARARETAARAKYRDLEFIDGDAQATPRDFRGDVVLFDVLHYIPAPQQTTLLEKIATCVSPGGVLAIRDAPRDPTPRFWVTYAGELFAQALSWNVAARLDFPSRETLRSAFDDREFKGESQPLWGRTPFNNHLFIFRRRSPAVVLRAG